MKHKRALICIGAALLFMGAVFRPGCRIIVNGTAMPGIYDPVAVARCTAAAARTAEEITRTAEDAPYTVVPVLCLRQDRPDETLLYHVLLESYAGVEKCYAVTANGRTVGILAELRDIYTLRRAFPALEIGFTETYTYAGAENSIGEVREALYTLDNSLVGPF